MMTPSPIVTLWPTWTRLSIFTPSPSRRRVERRPIHGRVRADAHVVADHDRPVLRKRHGPVRTHLDAEPGGADHDARVDLSALPDPYARIEDDPRIEARVVADVRPLPPRRRAAPKITRSPKLGPRLDDGARTDRAGRGDDRAVFDHGRRMDAGGREHGGMEERNGRAAAMRGFAMRIAGRPPTSSPSAQSTAPAREAARSARFRASFTNTRSAGPASARGERPSISRSAGPSRRPPTTSAIEPSVSIVVPSVSPGPQPIRRRPRSPSR